MRVPNWAVLVGWKLAVLGLAVAEVWRGLDVPTAGEVLAGAVPELSRRELVLHAAWIGALLATVIPRVLGKQGSVHAFGFVVGMQVAAFGPYVVGMLWPTFAAVAAALVPAVALACLCSLHLSGRGLLSLVLGGAVFALPPVAGLHVATATKRASLPIAAASAALEFAAPESLGLAIDASVDARDVEAVRRWLAPPWRAKAIDVVVAGADEPAAAWLRQLPGASYFVSQRSWRLLPLAKVPLRKAPGLRVERIRLAEAGAFALAVEWREAKATAAIHVLTPLGSVSGAFDEERRARFEPEGLARLSGWLAAMPAGAALRVVVVPPDSADPPGFVELRP